MFVPWVPTFLFQLHHTGTPWAAPADFTALVYTFTQFAGGNSDAGRALALVFAFLALLAIAGSALDGRRVVLDLRTRPGVRGFALAAAGTLVIAVIAGKLAGSTFADRYSAVILMPCLLVVAYGVTALEDRTGAARRRRRSPSRSVWRLRSRTHSSRGPRPVRWHRPSWPAPVPATSWRTARTSSALP